MTVKELRDLLSRFSDDITVKIMDDEHGESRDISEVLNGPHRESPNEFALQMR